MGGQLYRDLCSLTGFALQCDLALVLLDIEITPGIWPAQYLALTAALLALIGLVGYVLGGVLEKSANRKRAMDDAGSLQKDVEKSKGEMDKLLKKLEEGKAGIEAKLWPLPNDTRIFPGHGSSTTIGIEKQTNPYVGLESED